jgi:hypothetical protein
MLTPTAIENLANQLEPADADDTGADDVGDKDVADDSGKVDDKGKDDKDDKASTDKKDDKGDDDASADDKAVDDAAKIADKKALSLEEENNELKQMLRVQKKDIAIMKAKLERVEKRSLAATKKAEKNILDDDSDDASDDKGDDTDALSPYEVANETLLELAKTKGPILDTLLEVMELNPKYNDVREVCSQANFNRIFDAIGKSVAREEGKDPETATLEAEIAVWKMANPYKFMYDLIKKNLPKYDKSSDKSDDKSKDVKDVKKTPSSIANVPGKSTPSNAWTAKRIDDMDESELHTVPADIYEKYLAGDLE